MPFICTIQTSRRRRLALLTVQLGTKGARRQPGRCGVDAAEIGGVIEAERVNGIELASGKHSERSQPEPPPEEPPTKKVATKKRPPAKKTVKKAAPRKR